ncbi:hypothetical protein ACW6QP_09165 [Salegentibacter sp. HM20]
MGFSRFIIFVGAIILNISGLIGQEKKIFNKSIEHNGKRFLANFEYYTKGGDTIFDGSYLLTSQTPVDSADFPLPFSKVIGNYKNGVPDGEWQFNIGEFSPVGKGAINDKQYGFQINGTEFVARGKFVEGKKEGRWEYLEWDLENSSIRDTILSAEFSFKDDRVEGGFSIQYGNEVLKASVNSQNLAHKTWQFYKDANTTSNSLTKEWVFDDNILSHKHLYENDTSYELIIDGGETQQASREDFEISKRYMNIIELKTAVNDPKLVQRYNAENKLRDIFFYVIENLQKLDSTFNTWENHRITPQIKTIVKKYPYSDDEEIILTTLHQNSTILDSLVQKLTTNPQVNLTRLSLDELDLEIKRLELMDSLLVNQLREVTENYRNGNLEFVDREKFMERKVSVIMDQQAKLRKNRPQDEIVLFSSPDLESVDSSSEKLKIISEILIQEVQQQEKLINSYLDEIRQEASLLELEAVLMDRYEQLKEKDSIIDHQLNALAGFDVNRELQNFTDASLKSYSTLTPNEKSQQVEIFIECFTNLEKLYTEIWEVSDRAKLVEDAYTNTVFNPYTFTNMEEKVKEPIFEAYENLILPKMFDQLKHLSCGSIDNTKRNFALVFDGMINVLKRSTKKEERRIKRIDEASKAAEILNLDLRF